MITYHSVTIAQSVLMCSTWSTDEDAICKFLMFTFGWSVENHLQY